jgi:hypothetical protein
MEKLLKTYEDTVAEIFKSFGLDGSYGEIDIRDNVKWYHTDSDVIWLGNDDKEEYGNEIMNGPSVDKNNEYTIFYIDNGCGERYYQIFKNSLNEEF